MHVCMWATVMQVSRQCMEAEPSSTPAGKRMLDRATRRRRAAADEMEAALRDTGDDPERPGSPAGPVRPRILWSREECFLRTGVWCGLSRRPWTRSEHGGSHVQRALSTYVADLVSGTTEKGCTKHKRSNINLVPGCMIYWCSECSRCVGFSVMDRAESVRMPFEFMFTGCESAPAKFQMDNVCNADAYIRNREPRGSSRQPRCSSTSRTSMATSPAPRTTTHVRSLALPRGNVS